MIDIRRPLLSNVQIYYAIAKESIEEMKIQTKTHSRPKPNRAKGQIKIFDPKQKGFKSALVTIVFCGICLDALLHLHIGKRLNRKSCKETDHQTYEQKLILLGCADVELLESCKHFRESRNELVHEKAYFDNGKIRVAQDEAEKSMTLLDGVCQFLKVKLN